MSLTYHQLKQQLYALPANAKSVESFLRLFFQDEQIGSDQWDAVFATLTATSLVGNLTQPIKTVQADYQTLSTDCIILLDGSLATVEVTLPAAADSTGRTFYFKSINTDNATTLTPSGAEELDGSNNAETLILYESIAAVSDGTAWWMI